MYGRIPYLNNSLSSWATHCSNLRRLLYYTAVWLGTSPSVPLTLTILLNNFILIITLSFYILFLIPSFLIYSHKLFSMQLGPGTVSLACARLIVPFVSFNNSRGSVDGGRSQEILFWSNCTLNTILMLLQSPKTQEIKYKEKTITTFGFPLTPFCPKSFQDLTDDMALFCLYDDVSPHQVLPIKDDTSLLLLPSRIFFCLPLSCSWCCFVIWTSSITC